MNSVRARLNRHFDSLKQRTSSLHPNAIIVVGVAMLIAVALLNVAKLPMLIWGISKLLVFVFAGNWVDRKLFPNDQPEQLSGISEGTAWKRKTMIVSACILASAFLP